MSLTRKDQSSARPVAGTAPAGKGKRPRPVLLAALLLLAACEPPEPPTAAGPGAAPAKTASGDRFMVAASHPVAAEAGREMLAAGGSAVDATIAAALVQNVVEPQGSGIGGGGFLVHFARRDGAIHAYDGRETAPAATDPNLFLADGKPMRLADAARGGRAVGVPGMLRMFEMAHRDHGKLPWARLFQPAIRVARDGFAVSPGLARAIANAGDGLKAFAEARAQYFDAAGQPKPVGALLKNPELAVALEAIAEAGADYFYKGPLAEQVARAARESPVNPGRLTRADIANYAAKRRDPACMPYRAWLVCGMPPPSSGGIATLQILGMLQGFDLKALGPASAEAIHLIAEASRLAFADRAAYVADPDFVPVPTGGLIDPDYLALRAKEISREKAMKDAQPGMPAQKTGFAPAAPAEEGTSTAHTSAIDADGNAAAMTTSIERPFGSYLTVRGFHLNNQLTDFAFEPSRDGAPVANRPGPNKRPRSSMSPTLVFDQQGRPILALGSPGGARIIGFVAKTLIGVLDWEFGVARAVAAPNVLSRGAEIEIEQGSALERLRLDLEARGHKVAVRPLMSGVNAVGAIAAERLSGAADPRRDGAAAGR